MKQFPYGPCGLFCGACGATDCDGCLGDPVDDSVGQCKFRNCSKDMAIEFCCYCAGYPCKELREFMSDEWPHHWTMEPNLEYIKSNGVEKWLQAQRQEWSCSSCGAQIVWYQKKCGCGQPLEAWEPPE